MKINRITLLIAGLFLFRLVSYAQVGKTLAEKLGYPKDAKLLIIHGDDMGLSHSTNMAYFEAFSNKAVSSGSVMVPCPWFNEMAGYIKDHPGMDVGIHLTLNAEWKYYKWGGISNACDIPSLLDKNGYLYPSVEEFGKHAKAEEVEKELRAQIDRAIAMGIHPTHLDNHMGSFLANPEFFKIAMKLGKEYKIPVFAPAGLIKMVFPQLIAEAGNDFVFVDNFQMLYPQFIKGSWEETYKSFVEKMTPGLNELIVHLSYDNDEMKAIAAGVTDYGSEWRQKDFNYVKSDAFKQLLKEKNIYMVSWGQIQKVMYPSN